MSATDRRPSLARTLFRRLEVLHAVTYFAPEAIGALAGAGYRGFSLPDAWAIGDEHTAAVDEAAELAGRAAREAALTPLARAVVATGDIPATTPIGPTLS